MEHRPLALGADLSTRLSHRIHFIVLCGAALLSTNVWSAEITLAEKQARAERLEAEAKALRQEAAQVFQREEAACQQRILVNDCINAAKAARLEKIKAARQIESEHAALAREIRYQAHAAKREARARRHAREGAPAVTIQTEPTPVEPATGTR